MLSPEKRERECLPDSATLSCFPLQSLFYCFSFYHFHLGISPNFVILLSFCQQFCHTAPKFANATIFRYSCHFIYCRLPLTVVVKSANVGFENQCSTMKGISYRNTTQPYKKNTTCPIYGNSHLFYQKLLFIPVL